VDFIPLDKRSGINSQGISGMISELGHIIAVVDDEKLLQNSLAKVLSSSGHNVSTFGSGIEFLAALAELNPECVFLDVRMPGMEGIEVLDSIRQTHSTTPVIMMSGFADVNMAVKAMQSGASDFIEKPFKPEDILEILRKVLVQAPDKGSMQAADDAAKSKISELSNREQQVFGCLVQGMQNKVVAKELGISPRTVEVHRARIMERLNATNFAQLVQLAVLAGMEIS
jgi:FixJ family two-component response regulator